MKRTAAVLVAALAAASGAQASEAEVRLRRLPSAAYEVAGAFTVAASTTAVWGVLSDYQNIPSFVPAMKASRVREARLDGVLVVEQQASGGMFLLTREVTLLLEVRREAQSLAFEDVGRESFGRYEGTWRTEKALDRVTVTYHLIAQPDFVAPSFIMSRAMRRGTSKMMNQVRDEIVRRSRKERKI